MIRIKFSPKRPPKRQRVRFSPVDFHASSPVIEIVLRDLNSEGMAIETRQSLRVGASYPFRIRRGHQSVAIEGAVIWCKLRQMIDIGGGESQALYRAGISFSRCLDDFKPLRSDDRPLQHEPEALAPEVVFGRRPETRAPDTCPNCKVPAVPGAQRCRICGTILPQV